MSVYSHKPEEYPTAYLLVQAYQHIWLVSINDVYQQFTFVGHTIQPSAYPH